MLTELCQELRNWFVREQHIGKFEIADGSIDAPFLLDGQYYRIVGSVFNDGVHQYGSGETLTDETFEGAVWSMAVPEAVLALAETIDDWRGKYETADSSAMSPYMSESFGGYSYQKGSALTSKNTSGGTSWKSVFSGQLNAWRKL